MKIGIVGCGKIADQHADAIARIPGCVIEGVCDKEALMAKQMCERYGAGDAFDDVQQLLDTVRPDVVHITTPPQSHFALGSLCLESGCHVYIEKPFTLNALEAEQLIQLATSKNLKITVGHNAQFSPASMRMRELVKAGYLGGEPVHMESYYCYNLGDPAYARSLLGDRNHWVRQLPGKLLQNIICHGISKIAEFLACDTPQIIAHAYTSRVLKSIDETQILDELRVIISDNVATTAYFTFSSQISPTLHQFRIYGPENSLIVDDDNQTVIRIRGKSYKSYLNKFIPPAVFAKQYFLNSLGNISKFFKRQLYNDDGMTCLIESFYRSINGDAPLPISYREILLTTKIMDMIFEQINT